MALNIILDDFGYLESDSDGALNLSPILKQPPISPIESESSSGISSLDSDDLKVNTYKNLINFYKAKCVKINLVNNLNFKLDCISY